MQMLGNAVGMANKFELSQIHSEDAERDYPQSVCEPTFLALRGVIGAGALHLHIINRFLQ
jgi:hypothetical protein